MDLKQEKIALRKELLARRRALAEGEVPVRSAAVLRSLWASGLLLRRQVVALYAAIDQEVLTEPLFVQLRDEGVTVVLPRVRGRGPELDFYEVRDWRSLRPSALRIPEPAGEGAPVPPGSFDLAVIPGVAFDRSGGRLGYGMGCYDRVLPALRRGVPSVGLAYDFQLLDRVPREAHDLVLTHVISESEIVPAPTRAGDNI